MAYTQVDDFALQCANGNQYFLHVYKVLIFLYLCLPLYTCTVHILCFTEISILHRLIKSNYLSKKGRTLPFSKHFNLFLKKKL